MEVDEVVEMPNPKSIHRALDEVSIVRAEPMRLTDSPTLYGRAEPTSLMEPTRLMEPMRLTEPRIPPSSQYYTRAKVHELEDVPRLPKEEDSDDEVFDPHEGW